MSIVIVDGNPNPKALTLSLGVIAQPLRISIPRLNNKAAIISPISGSLFRDFGFVTRIDLFERKGVQQITLSGKMLTWNERPDMVEKVIYHTGHYLALQPVLDVGAAKQHLPAMHFFDAAGDPLFEHVRDVFERSVRRKLALDGGDAELLNIDVDPDTGRIDIDAVMIGSCGGCPVSKSNTLADTTSDINASLVPIKVGNPEEEFVQKLHMGEIRPVAADQGMIMGMR